MIEELRINNLDAVSQVSVPVIYKGKDIGEGLRLDILVEQSIIIELKSVEALKPVHFKQLQTYLKLTNKKVGLLINFNEANLMDGIHRVVNNY